MNNIESLKLDYVNSNINETNFTQKARAKVSKLFKFDKFMSSEEALEAMDKEGYMPANLPELLEWAKEWNGKDTIVGLGESWQGSYGYRDVPVLCGCRGERELLLACWGGGWVDGCWFAAVSKSAISESLTPSEPLSLRDLEARIKELEAFKNKVEALIKL